MELGELGKSSPTMDKLLWIAGAAMLFQFGMWLFDPVPSPSPAPVQTAVKEAVEPPPKPIQRDPERMAKALEKLDTWKAIRKLEWRPETGTLRVYVDNDGTSRDGYAESVCLELSSRGVSEGVLVRVMDQQDRDSWGSLGTATCPKPDPIRPKGDEKWWEEE